MDELESLHRGIPSRGRICVITAFQAVITTAGFSSKHRRNLFFCVLHYV
ncbi:hypothetical protein [Limimaricola sp.]